MIVVLDEKAYSSGQKRGNASQLFTSDKGTTVVQSIVRDGGGNTIQEAKE
jgi:hypothetical protein